MRNRVLVTLAVLAILGAPSLGAAESRPVRSVAEIRNEGVVRQYWDISCGAAVIATILTYQHGEPVSEREAAIGMMTREEYLANPELVRLREGFSLLDMKRFVEARGFSGTGLGKLTLEDLRARAPIIVSVRQRGQNHFVIVRGFHANRVLLADPNFGNRTMPIAQFERIWLEHDRLGRVGFVVSRPNTPNDAGALSVGHSDFLTLN